MVMRHRAEETHLVQQMNGFGLRNGTAGPVEGKSPNRHNRFYLEFEPLPDDVVKKIKDEKLKVQAQIQGEQVRVSGKKRDDLQAVIALLKKLEIGLPLQFINFRD